MSQSKRARKISLLSKKLKKPSNKESTLSEPSESWSCCVCWSMKMYTHRFHCQLRPILKIIIKAIIYPNTTTLLNLSSTTNSSLFHLLVRPAIPWRVISSIDFWELLHNIIPAFISSFLGWVREKINFSFHSFFSFWSLYYVKSGWGCFLWVKCLAWTKEATLFSLVFLSVQ